MASLASIARDGFCVAPCVTENAQNAQTFFETPGFVGLPKGFPLDLYGHPCETKKKFDMVMHMRYGGFWKRVAAFLADWVFLFFVFFLVTTLVLLLQGDSFSEAIRGISWVLDYSLYALGMVEGLIVSATQGWESFALYWHGINDLTTGVDLPTFSMIVADKFVIFMVYVVYAAFFEASPLQATLGKWLFDLQVVALDEKRVSFGRSLSRNFLKIFSQLFFFVGYLMILLTKRYQGLHDRLSGCLVVRRPAVRAQETYPRWY